MTQLQNTFALSVALVAVSVAAPAFAQHTHSTDLVRVEAHGTLSMREGIGGGVRGEFVVLPEGVLPDIDDDLSLTAGGEALFFWDDHDHGDIDHDDEGLGLWAAGAVQWNFYLGQNWSLFPELGLWVMFGEDGHHHHHRFDDDDDDDIEMDLLVGFGGRYHTSARSAILVRLEWPGLLQVGVQF